MAVMWKSKFYIQKNTKGLQKLCKTKGYTRKSVTRKTKKAIIQNICGIDKGMLVEAITANNGGWENCF